MQQPTRLISTPFAQEGEKTEIQNVTGEFDNSATYRLGFPPLTMQSIRLGGKPPKGTDFNGVLFDITENISFLCKGGRYQYNAGLSTLIGGYPEGSNLLLDDNVTEVVSTVAGNQNNPNTDMTGWILKPNRTTAEYVLDASGETQQQVNYNGGSKWHSRVGGYQENERVVLANGEIAKSTVPNNTVDPNVDMTGWELPQASDIFDESGLSQQYLNTNLAFKYSYLSNSIYQELRHKLTESVSVKDFGAIGDGTLRKLQEWVDGGKFSGLAAIQVVYPFVTSLDQSIDYAAIQKAINVSNNATGNNPLVINTNYTKAFRIRVPCGKYMLSDELDLRRRNYITLFGDDRMRSILTYAGSDTTKSVVNASNFADSMIENITLDANKVAKYNLLHSFDESLTGVSIKNKFRDLHLINNISTTGVALYVGSASTRQISESSFSNILFEDCWRCIELDGNQVLNVSFEHLYNFTTSANTPYPAEMEQKEKFFIHVRNGQMNSFSKMWPNCAKGCVALRVTPSQHSVRVKVSEVYTEIDRPFLWLDDDSTRLWVTEVQVDDINLGWFKSGVDGEFIHNGHAALIQANNFYIRKNGSGGFTQNFTGGYANIGSTLSLRDSFRLVGFSQSDYTIDYSTAQSVTQHFGRTQGLHLWNNSQESADKSALKLYRKQQFNSSRSGIEFRSYDGFSDGHIRHTTSDQYSFSVYDANDIELMRFKPKFVGVVGASGATGYDKPLYYGAYATWVDADGKLRKHSAKPTANNQGKTVDSDQAEDTAANIASITATINTTNKFNGKLVWDTTNNRMMRSSGSTAGSLWHVIDGSLSVTPI